MSIRGKHCYICGSKFSSADKRAKMILDRRERDIHSECGRKIERAKKELAGN